MWAGYDGRGCRTRDINGRLDDIGKEEDNMIKDNEVLKLYAQREQKKIEEKYGKLIDEEYNKLPEVQRYKELINEFETSMEELVNEYNREEYKPYTKTGYTNTYKYELNNNFWNEISKKYADNMNAEIEDLEELIKEVNAQLSLSDDKDYQVEVLTRYGILDKKGKITV